MSIERVLCTSVARLMDSCVNLAVEAARLAGSVTVIVGGEEEADRIKLMLAKSSVLGVHVQSLAHWYGEQWDIWGDGSRLVSDAQRHSLLRPVLAELADLEPSCSYVESFCSFVKDALALSVEPQDQRISAALERYCARLGELGLQDSAGIQAQIARECSGSAFVFVAPAEGRPYVDQLIQRLGERSRVVVLQRELPVVCQEDAGGLGELDQLRVRLFSGYQGLEPAGDFVAVEALGVHGEPQVVEALVRRGLDAGLEPGQIDVVFPNAAQSYPGVVQCLADAGIPVACELSVPMKQTAFGAALLQLEALLGDEDDGWDNSIAFISSPYSGLAVQDARGFASAWRSQAGSTHEARLVDLTAGLKGRIPSKVWDEKLDRLRSLLEEPQREERIKVMFENAKAMKFDQQRMADDARAADKALDYLELCKELGCEPCLADMSELSVGLARCAGDSDNAVHICSASQLKDGRKNRFVIFGRLDKDSYSMAASPEPFDGHLAQMGCDVVRNAALRNRVQLLDALEAAGAGFCCYRLATTQDGSESCQSALWDELMTAYRRDADDDLPVHELPSALVKAGFGLKMSEADAFVCGGLEVAKDCQVQRGTISDAALGLLFPDFENFNESFSPTAIEDYYRCPYRWFICRRVGANSVDKPFDQIAKGNLAHAVLERFYLNLKEAGIARVTNENLEVCLELADESFEWQRQHEIDRHRLNLMTAREWQESEVVRKQVKDLIRRDASFLPGFVPTYLELKLEGPGGEALTYAGVPVRGKVDRIDVDENGRAVVIDYKLSGLSKGYGLAKGAEFPTRIQTDIYATLVQRCLQTMGLDIQVVGSVYRSYAKNCLRGVYSEGIDWGEGEQVKADLDAVPGAALMESYPEYLERLERMVEGLMDQMRQGDVPQRPICSDACEYCLAEGFCQERR